MILGSIATIPGREESFLQSVASFGHQLDKLIVHFNGDIAPGVDLKLVDLLGDKVTFAPSKVTGRDGAESRFWEADALRLPWGERDVHMGFDDDILYPPDYVRVMTAELEKRRWVAKAAVAVLGSIVKPHFSYPKSVRPVARFAHGYPCHRRVHHVGVGTVAYYPIDMEIDLDRDFPYRNVADAAFSLLAERRGVELWIVPRPDNWLQPIPTSGFKIWESKTGGSVLDDDIIRRGTWPKLPDPMQSRRIWNAGSARLRA